MRSGCPHCQGGAYPACQHWSNVGALTSPDDNNVGPVPVIHPANGIHHNMAVTQYPGELRVAYSPAQWQQGNTQSQQNFQGLHQLESQASTASTGFHHPKPRDSPCSRSHQISRKANAYFCSSHVSAQHSSYCGTSANENSVRQSNMNINTGLQQGQCLDFASFVKSTSSALEGDALCLAAKNFNLQDQCSVPECKHQESYPLLHSVLKANPSDFKFLMTPPSFLSGDPNPMNEPSTSTFFSDERHFKSQQVPPTHDQIQDFIEKMVAYAILSENNCNNGQEYCSNGLDFGSNGRNSALQSDCIMPKSNSAADPPKTSTFDKDHMRRQSLTCAVIEQCTTAVGQALEEDTSNGCKENAELTPESKEMSGCATSASKRHSTEYLQIMGKVAATCTKKEDESPALSRKTLDELTEKHPSSSLNYSSSQEENNSLGLNIFSLALQHMTEKKKGDTFLKPVEAVVLDNVQGVTDVSEDLQTKSSSVVSEREDVGSVFSQTVRMTLSENKVKEQVPLSESEGKEALSVKNLKDPQYEDISDDEDMSQLATRLLKTEHEELILPACFEDLHYENISEDENPHIENMAVERPSPKQVPEPNSRLSPYENESYGQMKTEIISNEELIPMKQASPQTEQCGSGSCFAETYDGCHLGWQTKHSVSCSPSSALKDDETDDEMDDDWIVIPLTVSDLKFEPEDEDQDSPEELVDGDKEIQCHTSPTHHEHHSPTPPPNQLEEYETWETYLKAMQVKYRPGVALGWCTPEHEHDSDGEPHTPQNRRESYSEPEDNCETDDSSDYPSGLKHNYLTVSRELLKKGTEPLTPETKDSVSKTEGEDDVTNVQKGQTRSLNTLGIVQKLRPLIEAKTTSKHFQLKTNGQKILKNDIITIDSDTEDESDQNCKKKPERKRLFSSGSNSSGDAPCSRQKRYSPADSPAPHHQSMLHDTQFKEVVQEACSDLSHSTEMSGQLIGTKGGFEHVQHGQKSSREEIIIIDSETEDDHDQNYKKACRRSPFFSGSAEGDDAPCVPQKIHSPETVNTECETPADSLLTQHQSKPHDTQFKEVMQDAWSDLSYGREKSGQLIEAKSGSEHARHNANKPGRSEKRRNTKRILPLGSEDSGDVFKKLKKPKLSSEDSAKKQPRSADKEADSIFSNNPVIPSLFVLDSSQATKNSELLKEARVHMQGNDESWAPKTSTGTTKKTHSCEKNAQHLYSNDKGSFASKPSDRHHSTKNEVQANIAKPRLVSRQLLLPDQEGPSTSTGSLSSTNGQLSEARQSFASSRSLSQSRETSCSLPKSKQYTSVHRQHLPSSNPQLSRSYSSPSTLNHPFTPTKASSSATMQTSTRKLMLIDQSSLPPRRVKKSNLGRGMNWDSRTKNYDSSREARPEPSHYYRTPRQRHKSHKSEPPLLKKTRYEAIQRTKDINRDIPQKRSSVGDNYKWSDKPKAKSAKGSSR